MSCHDIGRGMNNVVSHVMDLYRAGRLDKRTAKELITVARKSVYFCDGNEGEAVRCMERTCGCCLRDAAVDEELINIYERGIGDGLNEDQIDKMITDPRNFQDIEFQSCSLWVCPSCFERICDHSLGRKGVEDETGASWLDREYTKNSKFAITLIAKTIRNIMESAHIPMDEAIEAAKVPEGVRESVIEYIQRSL